MKVEWNDVKEDYARKDAEIERLKCQLKKSLGLDEDYPSIILDKDWQDVMCKTARKRTEEVMLSLGLTSDLSEYSCAVNVLDDIVTNMCI